MKHLRSVWRLLLPLCLVAAPAAATPLLAIGRPSAGMLMHAGQSHASQERDALNPGDAITAAASGSLDLRLSHYGDIELGPASTLSVLRLPFSSFANDLSTELRLDTGTLRLVWKYPALSTPWPLVVVIGAFHATLSSGEYFFSADAAPTLCVRNGQAAVEAGGELLPSTFKPPACFKLEGREMPVAQPRTDREFIAMRANHLIVAPSPSASEPEVASADTGIPYTVPRRGRPAAAPATVAQPVEPVAPPPPAEAKSSSAPAPASAAAAPPAPEASHAPAKSAGTSWVVVAASLEDEPAAQREVAKLKAAGYTPEVEAADVKGRTWYRVELRGLSSSAEAREKAAEIKTKLAYPDPWVRKQ